MVLGCALLFFGCATVGPDYEEAQAEWLHDWQPESYELDHDPEGDVAFDLSFLGDVFDDPVINHHSPSTPIIEPESS